MILRCIHLTSFMLFKQTLFDLTVKFKRPLLFLDFQIVKMTSSHFSLLLSSKAGEHVFNVQEILYENRYCNQDDFQYFGLWWKNSKRRDI